MAELKQFGVKTFHMVDCLGDAGHGEFSRVEKFYRQAIVVNLSKILASSDLQPIWSAVLDNDWKSTVNDSTFLKRYPKPLHLCFDDIVANLAGWSREHADGEKVVPMFAWNKEYGPKMQALGDIWAEQDWYSSTLRCISFGKPSDVMPLQAADFLVHEIGWYWNNVFFGPRPTLVDSGFRVILDNATKAHGMERGGCYTADALKLRISEFSLRNQQS